LPLYRVTSILSFQLDGTWPVLHTCMNKAILATGPMAYFSSSAAIPLEPGARPLCNLVIALMTSYVGSSTEMDESAAATEASSSRFTLLAFNC